MIRNIGKLKNFGIFSNYKKGDVDDFTQYNLIYGWNGSGKSTLCTLFESLEKCRLPDPELFIAPEFEVTFDDGTIINNNNISSQKEIIRTFNRNFIQENIDWDKSVESILLVAKEKIEERKRLDILKKQLLKIDEDHSKVSQKTEKLEAEKSKFLSDSAKRTKQSLQMIGTKDSRYLNYNKTKLEDFIQRNADKVKMRESILSDSALIEVTKAATPVQKPEVNISLVPINQASFDKAKARIDELLSKSVISKTIDRLKSNADLQDWVSIGLELHKKHKTTVCEFCRNDISEERLLEIENHFSDEFKNFKETLQKAEQWLLGQSVSVSLLPPKDSLYDEFIANYESACGLIEKAVTLINLQISKWQEILRIKINNPFDQSLSIASISAETIKGYNDAVEIIKHIVDSHNNKTRNFEKETKKSKERIELHFAASEIKGFNYYAKIEQITKNNEELVQLKSKRETTDNEIKNIEAQLSNESFGADQFNNALHKFIGRSELSLKFNSKLKGYEIIRNESGSHDKNLSEGEKTAIAFIYFITKLRENDNKISDSIIIIDDPVSSFDSNHLFHAYSFLRLNCTNAKQLFVLTHNFTFFKLVRDWIYKKNKFKRATGEKTIKSKVFTVEATSNIPRMANLANADSSLVEYNSEYHYLFKKLYKFKDNNKLSVDEAFLTANLARKLLESFLSFKYPKTRNDFKQLVDCAIDGCKLTTEEVKEKIYRFINKYSHNASIEINDESSENLLGESVNIISDIFLWIQEVDPIHFSEMEAVAKE